MNQLFRIKNPQFGGKMRYLLPFLTVVIIEILDRLSKSATLTSLAGKPDKIPLPGILGLTYVENTGMAFGMFDKAPWVLVTLRILGMILILWFILFSDLQHWLGFLSLSMVLGGGIGNIIDFFAYGYVVDMIEVLFVRFAVFNVADCFITVGAVLLGVYLLFIHHFPDEKKKDENGTPETDA
ncbi:MAG: signal peptidase II [Clostridia bacterium]|nr:signal peptidase II [Clostridia bacterium]